MGVVAFKAGDVAFYCRFYRDNEGVSLSSGGEPWLTGVYKLESKFVFGKGRNVEISHVGSPEPETVWLKSAEEAKDFVTDFQTITGWDAADRAQHLKNKKPAAPPAASSPKPAARLQPQDKVPEMQPSDLRRRLAPKATFDRLVREVEGTSRS